MAQNTRFLNIQPFRTNSNPFQTGKDWIAWKNNAERQFRYFQIATPQDKKDGLLIFGGDELVRIEENTPDDGEGTVYEKLIRKLDAAFLPTQNSTFARYQFKQLFQKEEETVNDYLVRLREVSKYCNFADEEDQLRDQLVHSMRDDRLKKKALSKQWNLRNLLDNAKAEEVSECQIELMNGKEELQVHKVQTKGTERYSHIAQKKQKDSPECGRCARKHGKNECPAKAAECRKCGKIGHFAVKCRTKTTDRNQALKLGKGQKQPVRGHKGNRQAQTRVMRESEDEDPDEEKFCNILVSLYEKPEEFIKQIGMTMDDLVPCQVNGIPTEMDVDSGSQLNVFDKRQYSQLQQKDPEAFQLQENKTKVRTLSGLVKTRGCFRAEFESPNGEKITAKAIVVEGYMKSPPLMSRIVATKLGYLKIDKWARLNQQNFIRTVLEEKLSPDVTEILGRHAKVFQGIGLMKDPSTDVPLEATFYLKKDAKPVCQKPRKVPFHLEEALKESLEKLKEEGIVENVPEKEAITWCSPLVVQPKPKNPKEVRVAIDLRVANAQMERTRCVQAPIAEDFINEFKDCKVFSKLDMNAAYHQVMLDEKSRKITTFSTPWGNMRYCRVPYGALNSQDEFDQKMATLLAGLKKTLNNRDDILIGGRDRKEHNEVLEALLHKLENYGVTVRRDKCEFGKKSIEFFGHLFTDEGLKISPSKIEAVTNALPPSTKEGAYSFYMMAQFISRFIPNFTKIAEPIRESYAPEQQFRWGKKQQEAFRKLKELVTSERVLIPYSKKRETVIKVDGCPKGIAGGLYQKTKEGWKPVHHVGRALTKPESRYSQTEQEALAVQWTTERLSMYLVGSPKFIIETDHKPLLPLFNNPTAKLPPRIERFVMKMQGLNYEMKYVKGKENILDYLSRHSRAEATEIDDEESVKKMIAEGEAVTLEIIQRLTEKDEELVALKEVIQTGNWKKNQKNEMIKPYLNVAEELSVINGVVLRLERIILPRRLRARVVQIAHQAGGHLGISKLKERLRSKYWYPQMDKIIEHEVKTCFGCQAVTATHQIEPVVMTELPEGPWEHVQADFVGPFGDGYYALVVTDLYSRYPEVEFITSLKCEPVARKFRKIFANYGVPTQMDTDNGPPFNSNQFKEFCHEMGVKLKTGTPRHPKAQGQVESFNKVINKLVQISKIQKLNYRETVYDLLMAYRDTPHPATKVTPYELLMGRKVKTKLGHFTKKRFNDKKIRSNDREYKSKRKLLYDKHYNAKKHRFKEGDAVLVRRDKRLKGDSYFEPSVWVITKVRGSQIAARRLEDGKMITRNCSWFRPVCLKERPKLKGISMKKAEERSEKPKQKNNHFNELGFATALEAQDPGPGEAPQEEVENEPEEEDEVFQDAEQSQTSGSSNITDRGQLTPASETMKAEAFKEVLEQQRVVRLADVLPFAAGRPRRESKKTSETKYKDFEM